MLHPHSVHVGYFLFRFLTMHKFLPETCEKAGNKSCVIPKAITNNKILISNDSPRNCLTNDCFFAPSTLRIPTSAERFEERAVDKFIKLIHAINKVNKAIEARIYK